MANKSKAPPKTARDGAGLRWFQSLQFKLALVFLLLVSLLAASAYVTSRKLVGDTLVDESFRYEEEAGLRLAAELRGITQDAQTLAGALAQLAADPAIGLNGLRAAAPRLVRGRPQGELVASIGVWPEPNSLDPTLERASLFWLREASGALRAREDYNDSRSVPYYREKWYAPARYARDDHGYWTGIRQEPLTRRSVVSCVVPIRTESGFVGVASVSLSLDALAARFSELTGETGGYNLLFDGRENLLAATGKAGGLLSSLLGRGAAEVAKANPAYAPLALALHQRAAQLREAGMKSPLYSAEQISALKDGAREMSRQEAEDVLAELWRDNPRITTAGKPPRLVLAADPVLGENANALVFEQAYPAWTLVRLTPADSGFSGADYLFKQSLVVTLGLVMLTLMLVFVGVRAMVISPLRRMARQLESSSSVEQTLNVVLDESARNEVGVVAHWQNERVRQLREAVDNARTAKSQLASESSERRQLQDSIVKAQERAALALQFASDAIITTDESGVVDEMNPVAESLTGMSLREARGKPLDEVLRTRLQGQQEPLANLAKVAMERGQILEYQDGLVIAPHMGAEQSVMLRAAPMRSRSKISGAMLVFHSLRSERGAPAANESPLAERAAQRDLLTGLPSRAACERRIESLLDQARASQQTHTLIYLDVDHLKRINDIGGQSAGDDVLVRVAETLASAAPAASEVYRLAADQFAVIAEGADEAAAAIIAERLREQLGSTRFYWESRYFSVTASFGIRAFDGTQPSAMEVVRQADDACAAAKRAGRNLVTLYNPSMDRAGRSIDDATWIRCMKRGLDEDLFHLRTQWIAPGKDYAAEGQCYEVLLALEDEEGFWAAPAAFMPVAERHHMTAAIDRWVIKETIRQLEATPRVLDTLAFCSINLSSLTLADHSFLDFLAELMSEKPALAPKLCFELRETALTEYPQEAMLACDVLSKMGCRLAVDHYFGRHLSDLATLRRLPVDFVKVDAQAFKNLAGDPVEQMLAESTLRIVRHLRRRIIVNNVDDAKLQETWRKLGADYFQGYAYAKPSPVVFFPPD